MGFFDFFRRKPKPSRRAPANDLQIDLDRQEERQRPGHYLLAHVILRQIALSNPLQYLALMASPRAAEFLKDIHADVVEDCRRNGETVDFSPDELKIHCVRLGDFPCAVIEMPPPAATPEAYFTALVVYISTADDLSADPQPVPARYFTLEKGMSFGNSQMVTPRTVLCEWTSTAHSNFGDGPEPTLEAFMKSLPRKPIAQSF
jgi:hypothetical protein